MFLTCWMFAVITIQYAIKVCIISASKSVNVVSFLRLSGRGIKYDFPCSNIRKVMREVLKTEGESRGF